MANGKCARRWSAFVKDADGLAEAGWPQEEVALLEPRRSRRGGIGGGDVQREEGVASPTRRVDVQSRGRVQIQVGLQEGADVFANPRRDFDREARLAGNIEELARGVVGRICRAIERDFAGTADDFHALRSAGAKVK